VSRVPARIRWWFEDYGWLTIGLAGFVVVFAVTGWLYMQNHPQPAGPMDPGTAILVVAAGVIPFLISRPNPATRADLDDVRREVKALTDEVRGMRAEMAELRRKV
jgi:hypothetical protein